MMHKTIPELWVMAVTEILLIFTIVAVVVFDFTNGFHDAADMVATAIASHSIKTSVAIFIVCLFTFLGPLMIGLAVADTIGNFVNIKNSSAIVGESIAIGALLAAISYNLITWKLGFPSSSSNSLAGGLVGAGLYAVGNANINWGIEAMLSGHLDGVMKVIAGLFASPFLGFVIGFMTMKLMTRILKRFTIRIKPALVLSQYFSVAWLGFSHGANDAQKGMAIIGMSLLATGHSQAFIVPTWAVLLCATAITAGTAFGGWRIIKTLGFGLFRVRLVHAVGNQLSAALVNTLATSIGAPTSTTQVVTASLIGNGAAEKPVHVRWKTASGIIGGWFFNIPVSILLGAIYCFLLVKIL